MNNIELTDEGVAASGAAPVTPPAAVEISAEAKALFDDLFSANVANDINGPQTVAFATPRHVGLLLEIATAGLLAINYNVAADEWTVTPKPDFASVAWILFGESETEGAGE